MLLFGKRFPIGVRSEKRDLLALLTVDGLVFFFHFFLRFSVIGLLY